MVGPGEHHPRRATASGIGYQPWLRQDPGAQLGGREEAGDAGEAADKHKALGRAGELGVGRASKTSSRRWTWAKARSREAYSELNDRLFALEGEGLSPHEYRVRKRELVAAAEEEMEGHWRGYYKAHARCSREYDKWQCYCRDQREIMRGLEDLDAGERRMDELDDRKDQVMSVPKLARVNLAMWTRDHHFPPEYAHATWRKLARYFRLPGRVVWGTESVHVELRTFNDRGLNHDLVAVCDRVARSQSRLPDGETLSVSTESDRQLGSDAQVRRVA